MKEIRISGEEYSVHTVTYRASFCGLCGVNLEKGDMYATFPVFITEKDGSVTKKFWKVCIRCAKKGTEHIKNRLGEIFLKKELEAELNQSEIPGTKV